MKTTATRALRVKSTSFATAIIGCAVACAASSRAGDDALGSSASLSAPRCTLSAARNAAVETVSLWAPNHKLHEVSLLECAPVLANCDDELDAEFAWASSDEPLDANGDGHHQPDVLRIGPGRVCVRAERQGPKNGRVYRLGVEVADSAGERTEVECVVVVDHDQRGIIAHEDSEAYRLSFSAASDRGTCTGWPADPGEPPPSDVPAPDAGVVDASIPD
jgi:hypothetical protein